MDEIIYFVPMHLGILLVKDLAIPMFVGGVAPELQSPISKDLHQIGSWGDLHPPWMGM
jgi:hypothetical protein